MLLDLPLGPALSSTSEVSEIEVMYSHIVIHTFTTTVIKNDVLKNLAPLRALYLDVSNIRKSVKNINLLHCSEEHNL